MAVRAMREVTFGDIRAAARVLLKWPSGDWPEVMHRLLLEAHCADCYRKRWARAHPRLGNGTLMNVALSRHPVAEPAPSNPAYLAALAAAIAGVLDWKRRNRSDTSATGA